MRSTWIAAIGLLGCWVFLGPVLAEEPEKVAKAQESWITFVSCRELLDHHAFYKMRPDGSQVTKVFGGNVEKVPVLTNSTTVYREPHWSRQSPNGKWFTSWGEDYCGDTSGHQDSSQDFMIYTGSLDGSWTRVLAPNGDEECAWSPDSSRIAYVILSGSLGFGGQTGYLASKLTSSEIVTIGIDGSKQDFVLEQQGVWTVQD